MHLSINIKFDIFFLSKYNIDNINCIKDDLIQYFKRYCDSGRLNYTYIQYI